MKNIKILFILAAVAMQVLMAQRTFSPRSYQPRNGNGNEARIVVQRISESELATTGVMIVPASEKTFVLPTLELPDRNNKPFISRVLAGQYKVSVFQSPTLGECLRLHNVPGRSDILIHVGKAPKFTRGCILVDSKVALKRLVDSVKDSQKIIVDIRPIDRRLDRKLEYDYIRVYLDDCNFNK